MVAVEGLVDLAHALLRARRAGADKDAVGLEEVGDRRALLEEFGVGDDVEGDRLAALGEYLRDALLHLPGGADGYGGFVHDHPVARHVTGDLLGDREHVLQVGRAVLVGRGADGDELHLGVAHRLGGVCGETQAALGEVARDDRLQAGLPDRDGAGAQLVDLGLVDVHAQHVVADFREARAADQADVAGTENGELHEGHPCLRECARS